jgi:hypothetical protein
MGVAPRIVLDEDGDGEAVLVVEPSRARQRAPHGV